MPITPRWFSRWSFALIMFYLALATSAFATNSSSYTKYGQNINIGPNDNVSDATCFGCSIYVRGRVAGDVTAFAGNIVIADQAQVAGDVTAFGGNVRVNQPAQVAGDVTVFAGEIRRDQQATISGDVTAFGGRRWIVLVFAAPFLFVGLLIALVVWVVHRIRRPAAAPPLPA